MSILDEPMFPCLIDGVQYFGALQRVYAAIHLCVPESGDEELDAMIRKAQRQRDAEMAMAAMIRRDPIWGIPDIAREAYCVADAMRTQREKKP